METESTKLPTVQGSFALIPEGCGAMAVMGLDGDTKHIWDRTKPAEVAAAKAMFNSLVNDSRYTAYKVDAKGEKGEGPVREFDPNEERYIFVPAMQGG
jgi:hypothetical protein